MASRFGNAAILPRKQGTPLTTMELIGITVAMIIVFALLRAFHAANWFYPIAFYAVSLCGFLVRILRLISRR